MSRKQRKAAKRRVIRKARKRENQTLEKLPEHQVYSKCDSCGVDIPSDGPVTGWKFTPRQNSPVYVTCPNCSSPQEEALTWDDWDEF